MKICVLGLGYIGLPLACTLAANGQKVYGCDISTKIVTAINNGSSHIQENELKTLAQNSIKSGNFKAYTTPQIANVYIIAVPTPLTKEKKADLSYIQQVAETILPLLKKGDLIILESTSPPGTTKNLLMPILKNSKLIIGKELFIAYCPERLSPGNTINELIYTPRIIGGITLECAKKAKEVYTTFAKGAIHLTNTTTAEMVKVMENTYRDVNIALANELAKISPEAGVNVWEIIELANLHPRVQLHKPGPGVGGHCISVDPWFIVEKFSSISKLIGQARDINDSMPLYVYEIAVKKLAHIKQPKITLLGVTYKSDIDDYREAPSEKIIEYIKNNTKFNLSIYDPNVESYKYELSDFDQAFTNTDCIILAVDHTAFKNINPEQISKMARNKIVIDTRNFWNIKEWEKYGFEYTLLGSNELELRPLINTN